jgi:hypothetical protein
MQQVVAPGAAPLVPLLCNALEALGCFDAWADSEPEVDTGRRGASALAPLVAHAREEDLHLVQGLLARMQALDRESAGHHVGLPKAVELLTRALAPRLVGAVTVLRSLVPSSCPRSAVLVQTPLLL